MPSLWPSLTTDQLLRIATRYENAQRYIQGFYYQERSNPHVIRDVRRNWAAQVIYETDDPEAYWKNLRIEYMRYAMEDENGI